MFANELCFLVSVFFLEFFIFILNIYSVKNVLETLLNIWSLKTSIKLGTIKVSFLFWKKTSFCIFIKVTYHTVCSPRIVKNTISCAEQIIRTNQSSADVQDVNVIFDDFILAFYLAENSRISRPREIALLIKNH